MIGGTGSNPPAYLAIPDVNTCLGTKTVGTASFVCMPKIMPSAGCKDETWAKLSADDMGLESCDGSAKILGADPATYTPTDLGKEAIDRKMDDYTQKMEQFMTTHEAQISAFMTQHKAAVGGVKDKIDKAIRNGNFDFMNYQQQIGTFLKQHDLEQYQQGLEKFDAAHKEQIKDFRDKHMDAIEGVKDQIEEAVKSGTFDYTHFEEKIEELWSKKNLDQYKVKMEQFMSTHKAQIKAFMAQHKAAIEGVKDKIEAAIKSGKFDFANFEKEINTFLKQHDLEQYQQGLEKFVTENKGKIDEFIQSHKSDIDAVKNEIEEATKNGTFDFKHFNEQIEGMIKKHKASIVDKLGDAKKMASTYAAPETGPEGAAKGDAIDKRATSRRLRGRSKLCRRLSRC